MAEPYNTYEVGRFKSSVALGRSIHRMLSHRGALCLAYSLIKHADAETPDCHEVLSEILNLIVSRGKPTNEV